jgi:NADH dehydrogenase
LPVLLLGWYDTVMHKHRVVIIGGGFGGVRAALSVAHLAGEQTEIILLTDKPHFEYHAALYRVAAGRSPLEVCIPLLEIFDRYPVKTVVDAVISVDIKKQQVITKSQATYDYDSLVLALGSETSYFNIDGLQEHSFSFKSIQEAMLLKEHLHQVLEAKPTTTNPAYITVVGAGASGIELAGELAYSLPRLAKKMHVSGNAIKVQLVEAAARVAPLMPEDMAKRIHKRLEQLGIEVMTGKTVVRAEAGTLHLKDQALHSQTIIWTAGVKTHQLVSHILGLPLDPRGRVLVDDHQQVDGVPTIYAVGDLCVAQYGGMVQTALEQAETVATNITQSLTSKTLQPYQAHLPVYALPVGPGWAAVLDHKRKLYGRLGWMKRQRLDWQFFRSILPYTAALAVYRSGHRLSEDCIICTPSHD